MRRDEVVVYSTTVGSDRPLPQARPAAEVAREDRERIKARTGLSDRLLDKFRNAPTQAATAHTIPAAPPALHSDEDPDDD